MKRVFVFKILNRKILEHKLVGTDVTIELW